MTCLFYILAAFCITSIVCAFIFWAIVRTLSDDEIDDWADPGDGNYQGGESA